MLHGTLNLLRKFRRAAELGLDRPSSRCAKGKLPRNIVA